MKKYLLIFVLISLLSIGCISDQNLSVPDTKNSGNGDIISVGGANTDANDIVGDASLDNAISENIDDPIASGDTDDDSADDTYIKIPISGISTNMQKFSFIADDGIEVRFFAVLGSDGEIRTAFDACDVCGGRKGYTQSGNDVICNNCGISFSIDQLGSKNKGGGCWPSYLSHQTSGEYILIDKAELSAKSRMFR